MLMKSPGGYNCGKPFSRTQLLSACQSLPWHTLKQQVKRRIQCIENMHHQCVGNTLLMRSLGEAPIVVNAGLSV